MPSAISSAVEQYAEGAGVVLAAIEGLSQEALLAHPVPGTWSIQEIVLHLMDSDLVGSDRMKRVIAQERPLLLAYDENKFLRRLRYDTLDARQAAEVFRLNRLMTAAVLRQLPAEDFSRAGVHTETGLKTLAELVNGYVAHLEGHMVHLRRKREMVH